MQTVHLCSSLPFQVEYHRDYEASRGTMISVADDPELTRMKQMANVLSGASYTGTRNRDSDSGKACSL